MGKYCEFDVRVYPIDEPKGNTLAFATVSINDMVAIHGVRVVAGKNGNFVAMPQSQDNSGKYRDIAFPIDSDLSKAIREDVLDEYEMMAELPPESRKYIIDEQREENRKAEDVKIEVIMYPIDKPKGDTLAFASVTLDEVVAIRGLRVVNDGKGIFVSMPQSKDKNGEFHDVASPIIRGLKLSVSRAVLAKYKEATAEMKQSLTAELRDGQEQVKARKQEQAAQPRQQAAYAKGSPGIGD